MPILIPDKTFNHIMTPTHRLKHDIAQQGLEEFQISAKIIRFARINVMLRAVLLQSALFTISDPIVCNLQYNTTCEGDTCAIYLGPPTYELDVKQGEYHKHICNHVKYTIHCY